MKVKAQLKTETNTTVDRKLRRQLLSCPHCPPNRIENASRKPTHGVKKPRKHDRHQKIHQR